jgi:hypothetical protein
LTKGSNNLGDEGTKYIANNLLKLKSLNLSNNGWKIGNNSITNVGAIEIGKNLKNLNVLNLSIWIEWF